MFKEGTGLDTMTTGRVGAIFNDMTTCDDQNSKPNGLRADLRAGSEGLANHAVQRFKW